MRRTRQKGSFPLSGEQVGTHLDVLLRALEPLSISPDFVVDTIRDAFRLNFPLEPGVFFVIELVRWRLEGIREGVVAED